MKTLDGAAWQVMLPEGVAFSMPLAGPLSRCLASLLDTCCIGALSLFLSQLVALLAIISPDFARGILYVLFFACSIGYGIALEWLWKGQTLGKRLFGLKVMDSQGLRLRFHQITLRNLLRGIDQLPFLYLVGGLACLFSKKSQRLGDIAAGTVVVCLPRPGQLDFSQVMAGKFNSLRAYPHLAARLRQKVSVAEADLALRALLRRDRLEAGARLELFGEMATAFKQAQGFPEEAVEGLSDEQYVRGVVDLLYSA